MDNPRRIDLHHHIVPRDYARLLRDKGVRPGGIDVPEWSTERSRHLMKHNGIETAVLSVSTPGVWFGGAGEARRWGRRVNEEAAQVRHDDPAHFGFFATLTLSDVDGAIAEAAYALDELGADGIVLLANSEGLYLGDPAFDRLLAFLHERRAVVFVHPGELPAEPVPGVPAFTADFLLDTTRTALSLILSGALERYPDIRFVLAHAGGFLPYISYRVILTLANREPKWKQAALLLDRDRAVRRYGALLQRFWFDVALSSTPSALPSLLRVALDTQVVYGSDFPFAPAPAVGLMRSEFDGAGLAQPVKEGIDRLNALALFPRLAAA